MITFTGLTAARMEAIEGASIVDAELSGDDLILKRFNESTINVGSVRGPMGEVSEAQLESVIESSEAQLESVIERFNVIRLHQAIINIGGSTSGTTELELQTITVPEQPIDTIQSPSAFWSCLFAEAADNRWVFRIRDNSVAGPQRAVNDVRMTTSPANARWTFSIPNANARAIPANTQATYVTTIQRINGGENVSQAQQGMLSVLVLPAPS